ncbi:hypothetical protein M4D55_04470 [Metabacillus idriensis]|uniref:hypothetical protein n=1 Tax=Metabacillus idriensis TaxID=324768 RepID=UPI00203CF25D|nr:hypothetical protein [Metabacillus idriensis]MCM3595038.1 hypothetical protein [Metabacillus idriensis]
MKVIFKKFISLLDNNKVFPLIIFLLLILIPTFIQNVPALSSILIYIFLTLIYSKLIRSSIQKANSIFKQVIWLMLAPVILALLPFVIIEEFFPILVNNDLYFVLIYIFFFILSWVIAVFVFDIKKIKVAVQIVNALFLSILSVTFIFYFIPELLINFISTDILTEVIKKEGLGLETFFDIFIKALTIPYILSSIWANVAIAYREYKNS